MTARHRGNGAPLRSRALSRRQPLRISAHFLTITIVLLLCDACCSESHAPPSTIDASVPDDAFAIPDASVPVDASVPDDAWMRCPTDLAAALGAPCAPEGEVCDDCWDHCGTCDALECADGRWAHIELPPDPTCDVFPCGESGLSCGRWVTYCTGYVGASGVFSSGGCYKVMPECRGHVCDCIDLPPEAECVDDGDGRVIVTYRP